MLHAGQFGQHVGVFEHRKDRIRLRCQLLNVINQRARELQAVAGVLAIVVHARDHQIVVFQLLFHFLHLLGRGLGRQREVLHPGIQPQHLLESCCFGCPHRYRCNAKRIQATQRHQIVFVAQHREGGFHQLAVEQLGGGRIHLGIDVGHLHGLVLLQTHPALHGQQLAAALVDVFLTNQPFVDGFANFGDGTGHVFGEFQHVVTGNQRIFVYDAGFIALRHALHVHRVGHNQSLKAHLLLEQVGDDGF